MDPFDGASVVERLCMGSGIVLPLNLHITAQPGRVILISQCKYYKGCVHACMGICARVWVRVWVACACGRRGYRSLLEIQPAGGARQQAKVACGGLAVTPC